MVNLSVSPIRTVIHLSLLYVKFQGQFSLAKYDKKSWDLERPPQFGPKFQLQSHFFDGSP